MRPLLLLQKLMREDLFKRDSAAGIKLAHFLEQVFKETASLLVAVDLPKSLLLLSHQSLEVRVLCYCSSEG